MMIEEEEEEEEDRCSLCSPPTSSATINISDRLGPFPLNLIYQDQCELSYFVTNYPLIIACDARGLMLCYI
ncbi:hypothetical protein ACE6H2_000256 [Prunus campanulata]